jgi:uncharacterized protein
MPLESLFSAQVSAMAQDLLAPAQVTGLDFTVEQGKVHLTWNPVTLSSLITDYFAGDDSKTSFELMYNDVAEGTCVVKVDGIELVEGDDYTLDAANGVIVFANAPAAPNEIGEKNIEVSYRQNLRDLAGYKVFRKRPEDATFTEIGLVASTIDSQVTTFTDLTALDGSTYDYAVAAYDDEETPNEGEKSATIQVKTVPSIPQGLSAVAYDSKIVLRWNSVKDPSVPEKNENLAGYNIYRSETDGADYVKIGMAAPTETEFVDSSVENGRTYYYVITAYDNSL